MKKRKEKRPKIELEKLKAELAREKEDRQYDNLVHQQELARHLKPLDGSER